ncbi:MAG: phospholipase [Rhodovulum sulfidophilum]|uniref:Phospholipase n=1 Tax=Rhodovulum sulfidophilum TaxID=35806 RepID=A0A2W5NDD9_RHOSU|nr:MAG: phospholipase [Rhodovulum sulfidophilum]
MSESLIVFLHGVGGRGADFAGLAEAWRDALPGAVFAAPDGPEPFDMGGPGRQWFSVRGVTEANRPGRVAAARPDFDRILAATLARAGFADRPGRVALVGFSQGSIMALDALAHGRWPVAGVVAFSGRLAAPEPLAPARATRLLLVHGMADRVMPVAEAESAAQRFAAAGATVTKRLLPGEGHTISPAGAEAARDYLAEVLGSRA